jgi:hypothetical protein
MTQVATWLGVPPAGESPRHWHVSPAVDAISYHWSWLLALIPLMFVGNAFPDDYLPLFALLMSIAVTHRHVTMPYVYFDPHVFQTHPHRFVVVPILLTLGLGLSAWLYTWRVPANFFTPADFAAIGGVAAVVTLGWWMDQIGQTASLRRMAAATAPFIAAFAVHFSGLTPEAAGARGAMWLGASVVASVALAASPRPTLRWALPAALIATGVALTFAPMDGVFPAKKWYFRDVIIGTAVFAAVWNVWHTFMQKYGILRMYAAKSSPDPALRPPAWIDKMIIWAWVPLLFVVIGPKSEEPLNTAAGAVAPWLMPLVEALKAAQVYLLVPSGLLAAAAVFAYFDWERRTANLQNRARLSAGLGLVTLNVVFLFFDPIKAYIAYGFSHAVEYLVFVWAFERKRYAHPLPHDPLLGRMLATPVSTAISWFLFVVPVAAMYFLFQHGDDFLWQGRGEVAGVPMYRWAFLWTIWQSFAHFYYDGFLWKMRLPEVRSNI